MQFQANHAMTENCPTPLRASSPPLPSSTLFGQKANSPIKRLQPKRDGSPIDEVLRSNKRPRRLPITPKFVSDSDSDTHEGHATGTTASNGESCEDNGCNHSQPNSHPSDPTPAKVSSRKIAQTLMPLSRLHTLEDMSNIHGTLTNKVHSISLSLKSRGSGLARKAQDVPCQKVISWVLFQALNTPGAKVLGELMRYTTSHADWKGYMRARTNKGIGDHLETETGEPILVARLLELHASAPIIANTPLASLVRCQEQLASHKILEEMRSLLKADALPSPEASQLKAYLDRTQPVRTRYKTKLHNQIARRLGQTASYVIRSHRWGQRLQSLTNVFGPGIMTLFGSNAMKM